MDNPSSPPIYLDYAATTPCDPRVIATVTDILAKQLGHPHADHPKGREASMTALQAEGDILYRVRGNHVIWTSGATEANNIALICPSYHSDLANILVTCMTEHRSILEPCLKVLQTRGTLVHQLPVDSDGHISWADLENVCNQKPYMLSIMMINNETGVLHPIQKIGALCQSKGILFHVDASQAFGKVPIDMAAYGIDLMTISGHKIYGPCGIGGLVTTKRGLESLRNKGIMYGGKPQHQIRPGTPPVALCVGFSKATDLAYANMQQEYDRLRQLKNYCWNTFKAQIPDVAMVGADDTPFILNIRVPRIEGKNPLAGLNQYITFSTAAACNCGGQGHVTSAMGIKPEDYYILRLSFGRYTTMEEVEKAAGEIVKRFKTI